MRYTGTVLVMLACASLPLAAHAELDLRLPSDTRREAPAPTQPAPQRTSLNAKEQGCTSGLLGCGIKASATVYGFLHDDRLMHQAQCAGANSPEVICGKWR